MNKLIKINEEHYIIVDNSKINKNDWYYSSFSNVILKATEVKNDRIYFNNFECSPPEFCKKITHSTQPLEKLVTENSFKNYNYISIKEIEKAKNNKCMLCGTTINTGTICTTCIVITTLG